MAHPQTYPVAMIEKSAFVLKQTFQLERAMKPVSLYTLKQTLSYVHVQVFAAADYILAHLKVTTVYLVICVSVS